MKNLLLFLMLIVLLVSCNSGKKERQKPLYSNSEFIGFRDKALKIVPKLKSSNDIMLFFEMIEVPFMPQLVNDPSIHATYSESNLLAAANMGVYFADAMYQQGYGKKDGAEKSIKASLELSKTLGLNKVFEDIEKVNDRSDIMPIDSLIFKMDETMMQAEYILAENERMQIYISMLSGNFIQKQYLLLSLIFELQGENLDESKIVSLNELLFVLGQFKEASQSLVELIERYKPTGGSGFLAKEIRAYNNNLHALSIDEMQYLTPKEIFEDAHLKAMNESINSMRNYIIGAN